VLTFILQRSTLITRLVLVPFSLVALLVFANWCENSGLVCILLIIIFVGGLLILLVSVASISYQDQWIPLRRLSLVVILAASFQLEPCFFERESTTFILPWLESSLSSVWLLFLFLFVALLVISWFLLSQKALFRKL